MIASRFQPLERPRARRALWLMGLGATFALTISSAASHAGPAGASWSAGSSAGYLAPFPSPDATAPAAPQRAGRLSDFQGSVWLFDTEQGQWCRHGARAGSARALSGLTQFFTKHTRARCRP